MLSYSLQCFICLLSFEQKSLLIGSALVSHAQPVVVHRGLELSSMHSFSQPQTPRMPVGFVNPSSLTVPLDLLEMHPKLGYILDEAP